MTRLRKWLIMACLSLSGGFIYLVPYLREVYYIPMQEALSINNTQMGVLMGVFGAVSMVLYFPGGWLADRISARILITLSMLATGISGFWFATFPSFPVSVGLHAFWGVTTSLTFWSAMIRATRNWAPRDEQGRAFGILESGRGIAEVAGSTAFLGVFAVLGSGMLALSWVVILFSITNVAIGVMAWLVLEDTSRAEIENRQRIVGLKEVLTVLRMPVVWLISVVIMASYSAYWGSFYFTPYATDVFFLSVVVGGAIGVGKMWVKPAAALGAGFLADRIGTSKTISWFLAIVILSFGLFVFTPGLQSLVPLMLVNITIASIAIFALRGIYYALLEEGMVPLAVTGTAAGVVSVLGFTPDVFMPLVGGALLDKYPDGAGYRYLFFFIVVLSVMGLISSMAIQRMKKAQTS